MSAKRTICNWQRVQCPDCRGSGYSTAAVLDGYYESYESFKDCQRCHGTGTITVSKEKENKE